MDRCEDGQFGLAGQLRFEAAHVGNSAAPPMSRANLEIIKGRARRKQRCIDSPAFLIGRAEDCDLVVADSTFPDAFAYILRRQESWIIRHLGFAPALLLNGKPITQARLHDGDVIKTGPYEFQFSHEGSPTAATTEGDAENPSVPNVPTNSTDFANNQHEVLAEVAQLLSDVRREVQGPSGHVRLFVDPERTINLVQTTPTLPIQSLPYARGA